MALMEIIRTKPAARGVTELMYVGDSGATEFEDQIGLTKPLELFTAVGAGLLAVYSKGAMRMVTGTAAVVLVLRALTR